MLNRIWRCRFALLLGTVALMALHGTEAMSQDDTAKPGPSARYVMAAPRACLIGAPLWAASIPWLPSGAAENFPRADGSLRVVTGTKVVFALGHDLEAVWYKHTYGTIGSSLEVQMRPVDTTDDCNCPACKPDGNDVPDPAAAVAKRPGAKPCPWITLGRDGVKDTRRGPSVGHGDVGVGVRFRRPGVYYLRGIVRTGVEPRYPQPVDHWRDRLSVGEGEKLPDIAAEVDRDIVHVKVVVVDKPEPNEEPDDSASTDPGTANTQSMPKDPEEQDSAEVVL